MPKSEKQLQYEAIILNNFKLNKFDQFTNLKCLLEAYSPQNFKSKMSVFFSSPHFAKHHTTTANKMLEKLNGYANATTEEKTQSVQLNSAEISNIFESINNYKTPVKANGDFVILLNAYFYFFPEDRALISADSSFDKHLIKTGFDHDYCQTTLQAYIKDPRSFFCKGQDYISTMTAAFIPELSDEEALKLTNNLLPESKKEHSPSFVFRALDKLALHPSEIVKSLIRQHIYQFFMSDKNVITGQELHDIAKIMTTAAPVTKEAIQLHHAEREVMVQAAVAWLNHHAKDKEFEDYTHQLTTKPFYLLNVLIQTATPKEFDLIGNALVPYIALSGADNRYANKPKPNGYPVYHDKDDEPLCRLFMEVAGQVSAEVANKIKAEIQKLEYYSEPNHRDMVSGYMLQAIENPYLRPYSLPPEEKVVKIPKLFIPKEPKYQESAEDYSVHLFNERPEIDSLNSSAEEYFQDRRNRDQDKIDRQYALGMYVRYANIMSVEKRMNELRRFHMLDDKDDGIKFTAMTSLVKYNKRDTKPQAANANVPQL